MDPQGLSASCEGQQGAKASAGVLPQGPINRWDK